MKHFLGGILGRILFSVFMLSFGACNYNRTHSSPTDGTKVGDLSIEASMDYQSVQLSIISPQCLRCHSAAGGNQGALNLEGYAQVRANIGRIYFRTIEQKDMPPSGMSDTATSLLKAWIEAGAPEKNLGQKLMPPITGAITWKTVKNQIFKSSCLDCHSGTNPDAKLNLESYEDTRTHISDIFDRAIVKQTMPMEPYPSLSDAQKQALMKWISQGMPQ